MIASFYLINYFSASLFIGGLIALASGIVVFLNDHRKNENIFWLLLNVSSAVWSFAYYTMISSNDYHLALQSNFILHFGAIAIPFFYLCFVIGITQFWKKAWTIPLVISPFSIFFIYINTSILMNPGVSSKFIFNFAPIAGEWYWLFTIYFFTVNILAGIILLFASVRSTNPYKQKQYKYILLSSLAGFIGGGSVFFLTFDINIPPYPIIFFALYPLIIVYAIARLNLFNTKLIATQTFIVFLNVLYLTKLVLGDQKDRIIDLFSLSATLFVGYLLIRTVNKEIHSREEVERLAKRLTETNWELAKTNERLRVIDQRKSEFVSIVSHQLRTPITAIKGYTSLLLEDAYGPLTQEQKTQVEKVFISSDRLAHMVNDFLDISKIEQGTMKYEITLVDVKKMLTELHEEFTPVSTKKGLTLDLEIPESVVFEVRADSGKLRQIFSNLIDNAIKYTPTGGVAISVSNDEDTKEVICKIKDSGIGLSQDDLHHLFGKFTRGSQGQRQHTDGSGLGLYVAKKMLEAMGGKVMVDSEGPDKGSTFVVVLSTQEVKVKQKSY